MIRLFLDRVEIGRRPLLKEILLQSDGRRLLVFGHHGSGKSVLARTLCGDFFESTQMRISGHVEIGSDSFALPRLNGRNEAPRVGYIPSYATSFFVAPTVFDEVKATAMCIGSSGEHTNFLVQSWLGQSPLADRGHLPPLVLSGGQQRLLMLEVALLSEPDHLVIDGGLDAFDERFGKYAKKLLDRWQAARNERVIVYFSSSSAEKWLSTDSALNLSTPLPLAPAARPQFQTVVSSPPLLEYLHVVGGPVVGRSRLIRDATFAVNEGQFLALHGQNGAGKSTLVRMVAGIRRPISGEIKFRGKEIGRMNWPGMSGGIGYQPQEPELAGPTMLRRSLIGGLCRERPEAWDHWLKALGLEWDGDPVDYWTMSAGQRARASFILQVIAKPLLWIFDEPTVQFGRAEAEEIIKALRTSAPFSAGILISHDKEFLRRVCDEGIEIRDGVIQPYSSA